jgi:hypothetical protein
MSYSPEKFQRSSHAKLGARNEAQASFGLHSQACPFLISPQILRRYGAGQVDIAVLVEGKWPRLVLYEIKSSARLSQGQKSRLYDSQRLLSAWLGIEVVIKCLVSRA